MASQVNYATDNWHYPTPHAYSPTCLCCKIAWNSLIVATTCFDTLSCSKSSVRQRHLYCTCLQKACRPVTCTVSERKWHALMPVHRHCLHSRFGMWFCLHTACVSSSTWHLSAQVHVTRCHSLDAVTWRDAPVTKIVFESLQSSARMVAMVCRLLKQHIRRMMLSKPRSGMSIMMPGTSCGGTSLKGANRSSSSCRRMSFMPCNKHMLER